MQVITSATGQPEVGQHIRFKNGSEYVVGEITDVAEDLLRKGTVCCSVRPFEGLHSDACPYGLSGIRWSVNTSFVLCEIYDAPLTDQALKVMRDCIEKAQAH